MAKHPNDFGKKLKIEPYDPDAADLTIRTEHGAIEVVMTQVLRMEWRRITIVDNFRGVDGSISIEVSLVQE